MAEAASYMHINFATTIFPLLYYLFNNAFRGMGDSMTALWCLIVSVVINIFLDILFVPPPPTQHICRKLRSKAEIQWDNQMGEITQS